MRTICFLILTALQCARADVDILGLRVFGNGDEYLPPVITKEEFVTIEFDVTASLAPNLQIEFRHASKEWIVDNNLFVNDPAKIRTTYLAYTAAPNGVVTYTFRYRNSFPNARNNVAFVYSGNYIFSVIDRDNGDNVVAQGRFIVAENIVTASMTVENKYHPDFTDPFNQMNAVAVMVTAPGTYRADDPASLYHTDIKVVDIIKNWVIDRPYRIDLDVRTPDTFVDDFLKPTKTFRIRNIPPGNEYRILDLSNTTAYPNQRTAMPVGGPDVSRFQWQGKPDANGASKLRPFTGANSEYLEVLMRLRLPQKLPHEVFIVGGFSNWEVRPEYRMDYDSSAQLYRFRHWVRRGVYDYQYVVGAELSSGAVVDQDWIALEGNDWRTTNRYTALVYYRDRRFGGFDRIVGIQKGRSPGGNSSDKASFPQPQTK